MSAEVDSSKQLNFYINVSVNLVFNKILIVSFAIILHLLRKNQVNKRDEDNYDWTKYNILSENKNKKYSIINTQQKV